MDESGPADGPKPTLALPWPLDNVDLSGYTEAERIAIAETHLIPVQGRAAGLRHGALDGAPPEPAGPQVPAAQPSASICRGSTCLRTGQHLGQVHRDDGVAQNGRPV